MTLYIAVLRWFQEPARVSEFASIASTTFRYTVVSKCFRIDSALFMCLGLNSQVGPKLVFRSGMTSAIVAIGHGSLPVIRSLIGGDLHKKARSRCLYAVFAAVCESSPGYLIDLSIGTSQYSLD